LIRKNTCMPLWSFQGARGTLPPTRRRPRCPSEDHSPLEAEPVSQSSTACAVQAALRRLALIRRST
jgi:hypothetical protein